MPYYHSANFTKKPQKQKTTFSILLSKFLEEACDLNNNTQIIIKRMMNTFLPETIELLTPVKPNIDPKMS